MVTLKEVAAAAQVSTVTASSVLSGVNRVRVSAATAERIHRIAKSMNYVPLAAARGLRTGKTRIIAFVVSPPSPLMRDDVWHESLRGVSDLMWEREERLMLVMPRNREHELEILRQMAYGRQVDGFIIQDSSKDDAERIELLSRSERPFVIMGGEPVQGVNSVSFDMRTFAEDIAAIFRADNCGVIVDLPLVGSDKQVTSKVSAFLGAWAGENNLPYHQWTGGFIPNAAWLAEKAAGLADGAKMGIALRRGLLPEMLSVLEEAGLTVGEKSSIVYVSVGEELLLTPDGVTVMQFDHYTMGRRAARLLLRLVDAGKNIPPTENLVIPAAQKA